MGYRLFYIYQTTIIKIINYYLFYDQVSISAQKKESGELSILFELGLPVHLSGWMEYYAFHLTHPEMSNVEISYYFTATKSTIQRAITFMESPIG